MPTSTTQRVFAWLVLFACLAVVGGAGWVLWGRDYWRDHFASDDDDGDDDDDDDEALVDDAGVRIPKSMTRGGKHHRGKGKGKSKPKAASKAKTAPPRPLGPTGPGGPTYESAMAGNVQHVDVGAAQGAPDLTDNQLAGPMRNGTFLDACGAPGDMHVTVKVAIRMGRAVGVSVYTIPPDPYVAGCVDRRVRGLSWPPNAKMDSFVTTY